MQSLGILVGKSHLRHPLRLIPGRRTEVGGLQSAAVSKSAFRCSRRDVTYSEFSRIQRQPVHAHYCIQITSFAIADRGATMHRLHPANRTRERIQMDATLAVYRRHIHPDTAELDMHERVAFWSFNDMLGILGQSICALPGVSSHGTERDLAAIIGDVGYAAGVGPGELSMKPVTYHYYIVYRGVSTTHVQHPVRCTAAVRKSTEAGRGAEGSGTPAPSPRPSAVSPNKSSILSSMAASPVSGRPVGSLFMIGSSIIVWLLGGFRDCLRQVDVVGRAALKLQVIGLVNDMQHDRRAVKPCDNSGHERIVASSMVMLRGTARLWNVCVAQVPSSEAAVRRNASSGDEQRQPTLNSGIYQRADDIYPLAVSFCDSQKSACPPRNLRQ